MARGNPIGCSSDSNTLVRGWRSAKPELTKPPDQFEITWIGPARLNI
jgi:hypothetical protein